VGKQPEWAWIIQEQGFDCINMDTLIGRSLNRYKILSLLGQGGIGSVYKALDATLQREVAIKVMKPDLARRTDFRERFLQEARIAARLDHPNIVQVHDFGQSGDMLYIVMEYIPGKNLRKILQVLKAQNKWVILTEAVQIVQQVARALDTAHSQGILHLDIKPENLMLKPEPTAGLPYRVVVTDLGLARLQNGQLTDEHLSMGTPAYMSPEQAQGKPTDARSDVYSLGILLYELCVGRTPFSPNNMAEAVEAHAQQPVPLPRSIHPDLPEVLEKVILKALEKDPAKRYSHAGELANALEEILTTIREASQNIEDTISLTTQVGPASQASPSSQVVETQVDLNPAPPGLAETQVDIQDYIEILMPDQTTRVSQMKASGLTIGRDPSNDLILDLPKVSRQHARVQYDGTHYWISDLNSRNGTYLGNKRLTPGEPQIWTPEKKVKVGDAFLTLKQADGTRTLGEQAIPTVRGTTAGTMFQGMAQPGAKQERVALYADTLQISTAPGAAATASVILLNKGSASDNFRITVLGIPASWVTSPPPIVQLPAGGRQEIKIGITPAKIPESRPGRYPVTVKAASLDDPASISQVDIILTVGVYTQYSGDLQPRRVEPEGTFKVTVQNQGNARQAFTINPSDRRDELLFDPPQGRLSLAENEIAAAEFRATLRRRAVIGGSREIPFDTQINPSEGPGSTLNGVVVSSGLFPPVIIPIILILCLCLASAAAYGYYGLIRGPANQQTATANTAVAAATQTAISFADQGTLVASTAYAQTLTAAATLFITPAASSTPTPTTLLPSATATPTSLLPSSSTPTHTSVPPTQTPVIIVVTNTPLPPTITPTAPKPTPTPLGDSWIIAFSTNRDGNYEIYVMLPDGSKQTRITNNPASDTHTVISPDRTRILFVSNRDGNSQIYVMNLDGSGQARLSNNNFNDFNPAWAPDGTHITFSSNRTGKNEIYIMDANGNGQTQLTNDPGDDDNPRFSPDGSKIIYDAKSTDGKTESIKSMSPDGNGQTDLTNNGAVNYDPSFSPDGSRITFVSNKSGSFEVYQMNANGTGQSRLTNLGTTTFSPRYSRDGEWIVFVGQQNGVGQIFIINTNGSGLQNLTNNTVDNINPDW
jgi:serine/threonine protein kinase/Tol biopolymer transport system component